ncbi:MarR family winged helix-turn-helix transcriptional regulator [Ruminococcus sp. Marseille-P6503]|uniref:MarR family winged helix-turn-helix transcriptional regulator n=1 Tax=Ruminococcus sp. Marseille-P6503 TaxID=2364796 RepID=UPI000F541F5B|nr:MarR family winged helix-turn-helix transcriptional regulator [Ruminococcus sp. Marseille-P6503]
MCDNKKESILKNSKFIHLKIESTINSLMADKGITAAQSHVLMYILDHQSNDVCSTDIHKYLNISRATVSGLIKKLRVNGYLTYESCGCDERQKNIAVTAKALALREDIESCMKWIENCVFFDFSESELEIMDRLQRKMIDSTAKITGGGNINERNYRSDKTV